MCVTNGRLEGDASTSTALMVISASIIRVTWWKPERTCIQTNCKATLAKPEICVDMSYPRETPWFYHPYVHMWTSDNDPHRHMANLTNLRENLRCYQLQAGMGSIHDCQHMCLL